MAQPRPLLEFIEHREPVGINLQRPRASKRAECVIHWTRERGGRTEPSSRGTSSKWRRPHRKWPQAGQARAEAND